MAATTRPDLDDVINAVADVLEQTPLGIPEALMDCDSVPALVGVVDAAVEVLALRYGQRAAAWNRALNAAVEPAYDLEEGR